MADKRMLTRKVTDSDDFFSLSSSAQALYMHLCLGSDDDGFNNQVQIAMFRSHSSIDDLKVLLAKRFILQFENGVIVIKHWRMANAIRKDRYVPTNFQNELKMLDIKSDGSYTEVGCQVVANRLPNGCQVVAIGEDRIGEDRLGKDRLDDGTPTEDDIRQYCESEHLNISPSRFFSYYSKNGWKNKNGKSIDDWRQQCRVWAEQDKVKAVDNRRQNNFVSNDITQDDIDALLASSVV